MTWNWQKIDWPHFRWKSEALAQAEAKFLSQSGILIGATKHFSKDDKDLFVVEHITGEAIKTSEIEGEYLDRDSVQSSVLRNFGLNTDNRRVAPAERGIADMMTDVYRNFGEPLTHTMLFDWHAMLSSGRQDLTDVGSYRTHEDPMQVISGNLGKPKVHFEAPPSKHIPFEMDQFMAWWQDTQAGGKRQLPALTRSGIAHLYFVCIHPFEDGNGRIGRVLAEKSLAECLGEPTLIALSQTIERNRKSYYDALEANNKDIEITEWLIYFAHTILEAQDYSLQMIDFLIDKTKLYDRIRGQLHERQEKVLKRMFREGLGGFEGGLSAENYIKITGTSRATATRDLQDLVEKGALLKTGELKSTRYQLNVKLGKSRLIQK
jgi:Fic family protein